MTHSSRSRTPVSVLIIVGLMLAFTLAPFTASQRTCGERAVRQARRTGCGRLPGLGHGVQPAGCAGQGGFW